MTKAELVKKIYEDLSSSWDCMEKDEAGYILNWNGAWVRFPEADDAEEKCEEEVGSYEDHDTEYMSLFENELSDDEMWKEKAEELASEYIEKFGLDEE